MEYKVFARKYRPKLFSEVIGQEAIVTTLKNSIISKKTAQAYLFSGSRGTGKTTLMRLLAKSLNCQNKKTYEPCNSCTSCNEISNSSSLDVIEIDGASNRGIDDIRQINETVGYVPGSFYKIYIIDEVHMLTKEAFNALLKTLEEPPNSVKFFFATTEPSKILPTIISRCQRYDLKKISKDHIIKKLEIIAKDQKKQIEKNAIDLIAKLSDGSLRDAESILDQILCYKEDNIQEEDIQKIFGLIPKDYFFMLDQAVEKQDFNFPFVLTEKIYDFSLFLKELVEHFRKILKKKLSDASNDLYKMYSIDQCLYILDLLFNAVKDSFKNKAYIEILLLKIIKSKNRVSLQTLIKKLQNLKEKSFNEKNISKDDMSSKNNFNAVLKDNSDLKKEKTYKSNTILEKENFVKIPFSIEEKNLSSHYDTLLHFISVTFNGILKKI